MSQRRSTNSSKNSAAVTTVVEESIMPVAVTGGDNNEEKAPFIVDKKAGPVEKGAMSLEDEEEDTNDPDLDPEERYQIQRHNQRIKHWRDSPWACGFVNPTWHDEYTQACVRRNYGDEELNPDESGCLWCSALVCRFLGAGRVGNMIVLRSSQEWVEEVDEDEETGEQVVRRYTRPKLDMVVGPYWPMMMCCTYPIIFGVSGWAFFFKVLPGKMNFFVDIVWTILTLGLIFALAFTACCDPGILYRYKQPPPQDENAWRWTDRAASYRPRKAMYDADTAVVVEEFDHTCPWTGTAIGKKNMLAFQMFVGLVFICMVFDILVIAGAFDTSRK